jgi:hypothetical protein
MKKILVILVSMAVCGRSLAQQMLGIQNSNYAGIQGSLLNPSSLADSKLKWDLNIASFDEVFDNNFLYASRNSLHFLGFKKIISGGIHEDLFGTHFDPQQINKLYNVSFSGEVLGPSFFVKIAGKHEIGLTTSARAFVDVNNITGNLAQNFFDYFVGKDLWSTGLHDNSARLNAMAWLQYGLRYATVVYSDAQNEIKAGVTLNYLQSNFGAYFKNTHINYKIVDTANFIFGPSSIDYGRTDINRYSNFNNGHGFGVDLGLTYVHRDPGRDDYLYRIGVSLIDLGAVNFKGNAAAYHLQTDSADFRNWHQLKFASNTQFDQSLSAVFYGGDSTRSLAASHFKMGLPAALSMQADWNVSGHYFINATIIKGFGHGGGQGVIRPDVYSITPRYESRWVEVSVPLSLISYGNIRPRMGIAARYRYFFIGGDAPGSLLKLNSLQGVDFYTGVHFFVPEKNNSSGQKPLL